MVYFLFILNDDLKANFQAGVDTLYNKCVELGFTPAGKTPTDISDTIGKIYNDRYTSGYNNGYAAGRAQGRNDVIANPSGYGIATGRLNYTLQAHGSTSSNSWAAVTVTAPTDKVTLSTTNVGYSGTVKQGSIDVSVNNIETKTVNITKGQDILLRVDSNNVANSWCNFVFS